MSPSLPLPSRRPILDGGRWFLTAAFFTFCYCLLTWRALLLNDLAPYLSDRRAIALLVGAGIFWLAIGQLERAGRLTLVRAASWIVLGTIVVMVARLAVNWWKPEATLTVGYSLRWTLAWAAYFGLWLMGVAAFRRQASTAAAAPTCLDGGTSEAAEKEQVGWLLDVIVAEFEGTSAQDRTRLAHRLVQRAGAYETAELGAEADAYNARVRLAYRVAARLEENRR